MQGVRKVGSLQKVAFSPGPPSNTGVGLLAREAEDDVGDPSVELDRTARCLALTSLPFIG